MDLIISKTPLRISFVGGGTDYEEYFSQRGGAVINVAINKYVYVFLKPWFSKSIRVSYSNGEVVNNINDIKHHLVREAMKFLKIDGGLEISYVSDIPIGSSGTGLGSSSSLLVGLLNALHKYKGELVSPDVLASEAYKIERHILKHSGGKQDQYVAAYGGCNHFAFNPDNSVSVHSFSDKKDVLSQLKSKLLIFYTGLATESRVVSEEQKIKTKDNYQHLDELVKLTDVVKKSLLDDNIEIFGLALQKNWELKQKLASRITNPEIDLIYKKAILAGAIGGKILGSGGGGFFMVFAEKNNQEKIKKELSHLQEMDFDFDFLGSRIININE